MKKFNKEEARNMSQDEVLSIVCEGLADFTEELAKRQPIQSKRRKREICSKCYQTIHKPNSLVEQAKVFRSFSKIFSIKKEDKENGKSRRKD